MEDGIKILENEIITGGIFQQKATEIMEKMEEFNKIRNISRSTSRTAPSEDGDFHQQEEFDKDTKILQWNIRSIRINKEELFMKIDEYKPHNIALQETFLKEQDQINIAKFDIIRKDRNDRYGGRDISN
ncbi:hypothetical protein HHI36_024429 [Cryptolaemus montrouzieri]|uniref:Uncharacterized protein n=1 Tax=Cryptolaemus montrouzieri TaxID=559131 RepID=A0ABD2NZQ0_9CUCU